MSRSLIETVRVIDGAIPLWQLHVERLTRSAAALRMAAPALGQPADDGDVIIRYLVADDGSVSVARREVPTIAPLMLAVSSVTHRGYRHKVADRGWLDDASASAAMLGADDALLLDDRGRVVEASRWAVGWWSGDRIVFPPLALGGLPSVARERITSLLPRTAGEAETTMRGIADKAFFACNAARGVVAVAALDGVPVPQDPRTAMLAAGFWKDGHS